MFRNRTSAVPALVLTAFLAGCQKDAGAAAPAAGAAKPGAELKTDDEKTLYAAETQTGRVWKWDLEGPGKLTSKKTGYAAGGGELLAGVPGFQLFDSLAVDSAGNVCVATLMNGGITVMSPDGKSVEHVPMPDYMTTNICFGGPDLRTAYVTLSSSGRLVSFEWPRPGLKLNFS